MDGQRICGTCPVLLTCRDYAFTANIQHGTWAA
ncbi:WhiB family transcriptional regulator [Arthrobacter sp. YC-RL1]